MFERIDYVVARLDGDYAFLLKLVVDAAGNACVEPGAEEKCVARSLLPAMVNEGSRLAYEMMEYTLLS
jgi:hypothetical protein